MDVERPGRFDIAIVCALPLEYDAVELLLDSRDKNPRTTRLAGFRTIYTTGTMGEHNVVLLLLTEMGKVSAAAAIERLVSDFPSLSLVFLTGICGGVPYPREGTEVLLGDVAISTSVVQYDFGRLYDDGFKMKDHNGTRRKTPHPSVKGVLKLLETKRQRFEVNRQAIAYLEKIQSADHHANDSHDYVYPGISSDRLYEAKYRHRHRVSSQCHACAAWTKDTDPVCDESPVMSCKNLGCGDVHLEWRERTEKKLEFEKQGNTLEAQKPSLFFGCFASGDTVLKSGIIRDKLAKSLSADGGDPVIAFEMEGAGMWDTKPCLIVKGVCDYADSHKNKRWQNFAAATAASVTRAIIDSCPKAEPQVSTANMLNTSREECRQAPQCLPFSKNDDFVARPELMAQLEDLLPHRSSGQSAALWGLGGSGKTQLALNYAYSRGRSCSVFWVHAENAATFTQDFKKIASILDCNISSLAEQEMLMKVRHRIQREPEWLLIIDNADNLGLFGVAAEQAEDKSNMGQFVPTGSNGTILWTTRNRAIVKSLVGSERGMEVSHMEKDQAHQLLLKAGGQNHLIGSKIEMADELLEELQWIPLAVNQAGAYMRETSIGTKEYLARLRDGKKRWATLEKSPFDRHRRRGVNNSILETWHISIEHLKRQPGTEYEVAYKVLHTASYFDNQSIPWELLEGSAGAENRADDMGLRRGVQLLIDFCFLVERRTEDDERMFDMHKLVQEGVRYRLAKSRQNRQLQCEADFARAALEVMLEWFPPRDKENFLGWVKQCDKYVAHALRIIMDYGDICEQPFDLVKISDRVYTFFMDQERVREREALGKHIIQILSKQLGQLHPKTLDWNYNLAFSYYYSGRTSEAKEQVASDALQLSRQAMGEIHPVTIKLQEVLGRTYIWQNRYDEAEQMLSEGPEKCRQAFGENDPQTLDSIHELARVYSGKGDHPKAKALHQQAVELSRQTYGEEHPTALEALSLLATALSDGGQSDEAAKIGLQALQKMQHIFGDTRHATLISMYNLAITYYHLCRHDEAIKLMRECFEHLHNTFGPEHHDTKDAKAILLKWGATEPGTQSDTDSTDTDGSSMVTISS
ncbi:hypothetical protein B0I35DRAFT_356677 [Stachybotrys elegans]|uniref:Nucleoside phosphorylase domain-containing protein n=1 Tax=Stachybotrys elegans TaxID=80388 RepID=A0A8K0WQA9_9HYPO|nr:hypothetical protein B0I35DRAFT_356677 [Stachybotrys elegans]